MLNLHRKATLPLEDKIDLYNIPVTPAHNVLALFLSITFSQCRSFVVLSVSRKK